MKHLRNFSSLHKGDANLAGGKGASLGEMFNALIPVPPGFVVLSSAFDTFLEEAGVKADIEAILEKTNHEVTHEIEHASESIKEIILTQELSDSLKEDILTSFKALGTAFVAVRSSATAEDSTEHSWAGQLDSFLNTTEKSLLLNVKRCFASLFTPRAIFYRFEKGLTRTHISVAVVVQKMVAPDSSGIAFSVHPISEDRNQMIIEAGFGLGEAIVSGQVTPDSYVVKKSPREIIDINISDQSRALYRKKGGGNEWKELGEKGKKRVLSKGKIIELAEIIMRIENHYGFPCDIEWAHEGGEFYITQSRPITTLSPERTANSVSTDQEYKRNFCKFFTRDLELVTMEYWHNGEYNVLRKILKGATHFNPLFIHKESGITEVYYDMNNDDTALIPLFEYFTKNPHEFDRAVDEFKKLHVKIRKLIANFTFASFEELFNTVSEAWGYLPIWVQFASTDEHMYGKHFVKTSYKLRDEFQDVEYTVGEVLKKAIEKEYPEVKQHADVISYEEAWTNTIPSLEELQLRANGLIYFEGDIFTNRSIHDFEKNCHVIVDEGLRTIGEPQVVEGGIPNIATAEIHGVTATRGKIAGKVRLVLTKKALQDVLPGEVMVTYATSPDYVPMIKICSAIITDEGGVVCHAAIVSRELGIPCVVGTKTATQILKTGDLVEVDAERGIVRIIERSPEVQK